MKIVEEMQDYYGRRASTYDTSMGYDNEQVIRALLPIAVKIRETMRDREVLEIACGPGFWTHFLCDAASKVIATDFNQSALDEARKKSFPQNVTFIQADAYRLDEIPNTYDGMLAVDWFAHVPLAKMNDFLTNALRKMRAGATLMFIDQLPRENSLTKNYDGDGNHIQTRTLTDGSTYSVVKHFFADEEIQRIFSPFAGEVKIERNPECMRIIVTFHPSVIPP